MKKMRGRKSHVTVPLSLRHCEDTFSQQADESTWCSEQHVVRKYRRQKKTSVQYDLFWKKQRLCGIRTSIPLFCGEFKNVHLDCNIGTHTVLHD
jgi:hypothetical protein